MAKEKTLSIIKPDAVEKKQVESIYQRLKEKNLKIIASKENYTLKKEEAEKFYSEHQGKPFFEGLIQTMTKGPIFIQVLESENAIENYRQLMGPTDPKQATPGTLRAEFGGKELPRNAVHGSDSPFSAEREIAFFFKKLP